MEIHVEKNTITASVGSLSSGETFMFSGKFYIVTDMDEISELIHYDLIWSIDLDSGYCRTFPRETEVDQVELVVVLKEDLHEL